jgi:hypothetical protein
MAFSSLQRTKSFATWVRKISAALRCQVQCPYCGKPAYFTGQRHNRGRGRHANGAYLFYHKEKPKSTHGGAAVIPRIVLVRLPRKGVLLQESNDD